MQSEGSSLDIISTLPEPILETILCLLPTKHAVRTSILSREWRYKWTTISKLDVLLPLSSIRKENQLDTRRTPFLDLLQVLLLHKGLIQEFSLFMNRFVVVDQVGFDQVLLHLSKDHKLKKLKLRSLYGLSWPNLPVSIFSLHHLIELHISLFNLDHQPIFNGFGSLRSLSLINVGISTKTLLHLLAKCPSLKSLTLAIVNSHLGGEDFTVIELFKRLPMIEHLTTYSGFLECSPNLEKIEIDRLHTYDKYDIVWKEYSDFWLEHLSELTIERSCNSKPEMEFMKFIMARSPKLKKVNLWGYHPKEVRFEMLQSCIRAPRANPDLCMNVASKLSIPLNFKFD